MLRSAVGYQAGGGRKMEGRKMFFERSDRVEWPSLENLSVPNFPAFIELGLGEGWPEEVWRAGALRSPLLSG